MSKKENKCECVNGWVRVINFQEGKEYDVPCEKCTKGIAAIQEMVAGADVGNSD